MTVEITTVRSPTQAVEELERLSESMSGPNTVRVGLPKGSNDYPDGTSVIAVGTTHEFGSPSRNIPQRSFLRATLTDKRREYKQLLRELARKIVNNEMTKNQALGLTGLKFQGDVQERITNGIEPELKWREGTPLIDTGHLRQSITFEIDE